MFDLTARFQSPFVFRTNNISQFTALDGIFLLDGKKMVTIDEYHDEIARVFQFPNYYGRNHNATNDMLTDLDWLERDYYIVIIKNGQKVLEESSDRNLEVFVSILKRAGQYWKDPTQPNGMRLSRPRPFHSIFELNEGVYSKTLSKLEAM